MENAQPIFDSAAGPGRYGVAAMFDISAINPALPGSRAGCTGWE